MLSDMVINEHHLKKLCDKTYHNLIVTKTNNKFNLIANHNILKYKQSINQIYIDISKLNIDITVMPMNNIYIIDNISNLSNQKITLTDKDGILTILNLSIDINKDLKDNMLFKFIYNGVMANTINDLSLNLYKYLLFNDDLEKTTILIDLLNQYINVLSDNTDLSYLFIDNDTSFMKYIYNFINNQNNISLILIDYIYKMIVFFIVPIILWVFK